MRIGGQTKSQHKRAQQTRTPRLGFLAKARRAIACGAVVLCAAAATIGVGIQPARAEDDSQEPANHWQVVNPGGTNEDSNVRVHKTVEGTGTENEFKIHLSVDVKPQNDIEEIFNATAILENNNSSGSTLGHVQKQNGNQCVPGGNKPFYYKYRVKDLKGEYHESSVIYAGELTNGGAKTASISPDPSVIDHDGNLLCVWNIQDQGTGTGSSKDDPAIFYIDMSWPGYEEVFGTSNTDVSLGTATDVMGDKIDFKGFEGNPENAAYDSGSKTINWDLSHAAINPDSVEDDGWINNVASLDYFITLNVDHSNGFPASSARGNVYPTNSKAELSYSLVTTTQMGDGDPIAGEPVEQQPVVFPVPEVRGLLYDLVAKKTSSSSYEAEHKPLAGATFEIKNADGDVISSNVTSDENGQIAYEGLPHGTYTITETKAPDGYQLPENVADRSWTVTLCYTTNASSLELSSLNEGLDAMPSREIQKEFVNPKAPVTYQIPVGKTIDGRPWHEDDSFAFKIEAAGYSEGVSGEPVPMENQPMPMKDGEIASEVTVAYSDYLDTTNPDAGADAIGESEDISFSKPGYYFYKISEVSGTATDLEYSKETYLFWVDVKENEDTGKLEIGGYTCSLLPQTGASERALSNVPVFTNTYTASLVIKKTDEDNNPLGGAVFQVTCEDPKYNKTVTTDKDTGEATFESLLDGTYVISETGVPDGYQKLPDLTLAIKNGAAKLTYKDTGKPYGNGEVSKNDDGAFVLPIVNYSMSNLPSTGSSGTVLMEAVGVAAMVLGGAWIAQKRISHN